MTPSILILRLSSLGDVVLTTPLIAALRERYPECRIDMVVAAEYESLVPVMSGLTRVHIFDRRSGLSGLRGLRRELRPEQYDYVLDLHNVPRTRILRRGLGRQVSVINKRTFRRWLLVRFKIDMLKRAPDIIGRYFETAKSLGISDNGSAPHLAVLPSNDSKKIAIAPGARHWNKRWPAEYFQEVAKTLIERGWEVVFFGSEAERGLIDEICSVLPSGYTSVIGEPDLALVARSLANCEIVITNDSGLMHLASAVGTPVVVLFGPTVRQFGFAPRAAPAMHPKSVVLEVEGLNCRPCTAIGSDHCPEKHFRCMKEITPQRVLESIGIIASSVSQETRA